MTGSTVTTRILIISDTHCAPLTQQDDSSNNPFPPFEAPLPSADLLIHCGDLTYTGEMHEYHQTLDMLQQINAPVKLVIAGNHDLSLDRDFVFSHLSKPADSADTLHFKQFTGLTELQADLRVLEARDLWTSPNGRAKREGITFLDEGLHHIDLPNGARINIYASPYTPEFRDWGFPYEHKEDRFNTPLTSLSDAKNLAPYPVPELAITETPIDVLITHGPPYRRLDQVAPSDPAGCPHLLRALMSARPLIHCFGHIHEGWGAELVRWSASVDHAASTNTDIANWKQAGWESGVSEVEVLPADIRRAIEDHGVFLDLSRNGRNISRGQETALVNAAIMDVAYHPVNAPWVVDVDLPKRS